MKATILHGLLDRLNGATFLGIDLETEPLMNKTMPDAFGGPRLDNPHYGHIVKATTGMVVMVSTNKSGSVYERMIRRRQLAQGHVPDFTEEKRRWGVRVGTTPFIEHKGQTYLELFCLQPGTTTFTLNGQPIPREDIIGLIESSPADDAQGGIDHLVVVRNVKAESITGMRIDGVDITVR